MSKRAILVGIFGLVLTLGFAFVAQAQEERPMRRGQGWGDPAHDQQPSGPALDEAWILVLELPSTDKLGELRPGDTWTMEPGQTLRFRMVARSQGGPVRYPAATFQVVSGREHVKVEGSNRDVGNVTITATRAAHVRGERTEVRYEIVDQEMRAQPRVRTDSFFLAVEARYQEPEPGRGELRGMTLYEHQDFRGNRESFQEGEVRDLKFTRFPPDIASSIQLSQGCRVVLYEHPNFEGRSAVLTRDETDLRRHQMNDNLSSFILECFGDGRPGRPGTAQPRPGRQGPDRGAVTIYEHQDFRGRSETFFEGEIGDLRTTRIGHDVASSIEVAPGCRVILYEHPNFEGRSTVLTEDETDLGRTRVGNDTLSSFRIECGRR